MQMVLPRDPVPTFTRALIAAAVADTIGRPGRRARLLASTHLQQEE